MEVEIKAPAPEGIDRILSELNAEFREEVLEIDTYFNHPCRDFSVTDEAIRIRRTIRGNEKITITYKGPKVDKDTKSREEVNLNVDSFENAVTLLKNLGFVPVANVRKRRKYYRIGDVTVCVDSVENLGNYVEVECIGDYDECRGKVIEIASKMGLKNFERHSYLELVLQTGTA